MKYVVLLAALFPFFTATAEITKTNPSTISIGCSFATPPFIIQQNNRGILLDILRTSLRHENIELNLSYSGNEKNLNQFLNHELDALCISTPHLTPNAWLSKEPSMVFHNVVVSLEKNNLEIKSSNDLRHYRIQGFGHALKMLAPDYRASVMLSPNYTEETDQIKQVEALFNGKVDAIVIELTVFRYYLSQLRRADPFNPALSENYQYADILQPTVYYTAFRDKEMRDRFDLGFQKVRKSGDDIKIRQSYERLLADYLLN